jgi:cytidine kinase
MYYTIGGFTLDDTVLPTGEVRWAMPGGNALYSAIGAKLWGAAVGIVAPVGQDYPQEYLNKLELFGFNLTGVCRISHPSFHVWVLHEGDGKRQIIYRLDSGLNTFLDPRIDQLPPQVTDATGVHICPILGASQAALLKYLLPRGVPVSLDLIEIQNQIDVINGHEIGLWHQLRAFMPSIEEVKALWGDLPLKKLVKKIEEAGPEIFAIKLGRAGCLVRNRQDGLIYHVPAYPTKAIDATGAGDSFCGGFMVGLQESDDPVQAAIQGTVSASFLIEDFGALHALGISRQQVQERFEFLRPKVKLFDGSGLDSDPI